MLYENQVLVFPIGLNLHWNLSKSPCYSHTFDTCMLKRSSRRKTVKIGNATRMKTPTEDCTFKNCTIFFEGTLTDDGIIPFQITDKYFFYFESE